MMTETRDIVNGYHVVVYMFEHPLRSQLRDKLQVTDRSVVLV